MPLLIQSWLSMANKRWKGDLKPLIASSVLTLCLFEKGTLALVRRKTSLQMEKLFKISGANYMSVRDALWGTVSVQSRMEILKPPHTLKATRLYQYQDAISLVFAQ